MKQRVVHFFTIVFFLLGGLGERPTFAEPETWKSIDAQAVISGKVEESQATVEFSTKDAESQATAETSGPASDETRAVRSENSRAFLFLKAEERKQIELLRTLTPTLVAIYPPDGSSCGSGVVISEDGFVVTNFHVVQPCGVWMKCGLADGCVYHAVIVGLDPTGDVALIRLLPEIQTGKPNLENSGEPADFFGETPEGKPTRKRFTSAKFGDSDQVRQGDRIWVLGNPFSFEEDFTPGVSTGVVSGTHRYQYPADTFLEYADCIQVDAAVNPGNSGGPLFNDAGELIGINGRCSFEKRGRINVGVGYAISINQIRYFLSGLRAGRVLDHAAPGATVSSDALGRPVVDEIVDESEIALRGLETGDRILAFGGRSIQTVNEFKNILGIFPKGWITPIEFVRKTGARLENHRITIRLGGVHSERELQEFLTYSFGNDAALPEQKPNSPRMPGAEPLPNPLIPEELRRMTELFKDLKNLPPEVAAVYEKREGWVNFHFNRQEVKRVWDSFSVAQSLANASTSCRGTNLGGQEFELKFAPDKTLLKQNETEILWENRGDFTRQATPPESRLLLPGMTIWKVFCEKGPQALDFTYFGDSPLPFTSEKIAKDEVRKSNAHDDGEENEEQALFDVLEGNVGGVNVRFFFTKSPKPGTPCEIRQMELDFQDGALPWEFRFSSWRQTENGFLPETAEVFADGKIFESFQIKTWGEK